LIAKKLIKPCDFAALAHSTRSTSFPKGTTARYSV
jgi:hypothetical protein